MLNLDAIKRDGDLLFAELDIEYSPRKPKYLCPFHAERTPSLEVRQEDGHWLFKCFGCGKSGTLVDAVLYRRNKRNIKEALAELERDLGFKFSNPEKEKLTEIQSPTIDIERAKKFVTHAHETLLDRLDLQKRWMADKRGLNIETCSTYHLGFCERFAFSAWPTWSLQNAWVIPITAADGSLLAVKIHFETPPKPGMKCMWAPFGLEPREKPRHGYPCLWPPPENYPLIESSNSLFYNPKLSIGDNVAQWPDETRHDFVHRVSIATIEMCEAEKLHKWNASKDLTPLDFTHTCAPKVFRELLDAQGPAAEQQWLYLCPGELKALAMIAAGKQAVSVTSGESQKMPSYQMARLRGRRVCIVYDDDEAGVKWLEQMTVKLREVAAEFAEITYGRVLAA